MNEREFQDTVFEIRELLVVAEDSMMLLKQMTFSTFQERKAHSNIRRLLKMVRFKLATLEPTVENIKKYAIMGFEAPLNNYLLHRIDRKQAGDELMAMGYSAREIGDLLVLADIQRSHHDRDGVTLP